MKTIWITGGSSGIGYTTAEKFLNEGWRVIISSSKDENLIQAKLNLEKKTQSKEIYSFKCDISNRNEVNYVVKKISTEISSINIALLNEIPGFIWFAAKTSLMLFTFLWVRATFPRFRYDQLMRIGWKVFLPFSLLWVVLTSGFLIIFDLLPSSA